MMNNNEQPVARRQRKHDRLHASTDYLTGCHFNSRAQWLLLSVSLTDDLDDCMKIGMSLFAKRRKGLTCVAQCCLSYIVPEAVSTPHHPFPRQALKVRSSESYVQGPGKRCGVKLLTQNSAHVLDMLYKLGRDVQLCRGVANILPLTIILFCLPCDN